jgi:hypothetical protein
LFVSRDYMHEFNGDCADSCIRTTALDLDCSRHLRLLPIKRLIAQPTRGIEAADAKRYEVRGSGAIYHAWMMMG